MKAVIIGLSLSLASLLAHADGKMSQYEQAAVNAAALDPDEALVNDDGAVEDPNARMSGTARAYRNGYYNGKQAQREQDESTFNPPPLPQLPRQARQAPRVSSPYDQQYGGQQYTPPAPYGRVPQYDGAYAYNERPVPPVNVYVQAPQPVYAPRPEPVYTQAPAEYYEPPPGPPESTYVIVRGVPPTLATGYWPGYAVRPMPRPAWSVHGWVRWH